MVDPHLSCLPGASMRKVVLVGLLLIGWWLSSAIIVITRSPLILDVIRNGARVVAIAIPPVEPSNARLAEHRDSRGVSSLMPVFFERNVHGSFRSLDLNSVRQVVNRVPPWGVTANDTFLLVFPAHALMCVGMAWLIRTTRVPRAESTAQARDPGVFLLLWRTATPCAILLATPPLLWVFWHELGLRHGVLLSPRVGGKLPFVSPLIAALDLVYLGAFLAYLWILCSAARRLCFEAGPKAAVADWTSSCVRCGYHLVIRSDVETEPPCSECGEPRPRSMKAVFLGKWHARVGHGRSFDRWFSAGIWTTVFAMCVAPLLRGVFLEMFS